MLRPENVEEFETTYAPADSTSKVETDAARSTNFSTNTFNIEFDDETLILNSTIKNRVRAMFSRFGFSMSEPDQPSEFKVIINATNSGYHLAGNLVTSVLNLDITVIANEDKTVVFSDSISVSGGGADESNAKRNLLKLALKKFEATYDDQLREILE